METVKMERAFFERTPAGIVALRAYRDWKRTQADRSGEGSQLLAELGLKKKAPAKIKGGLVQRILNALDGEVLTLEELVETINTALGWEGNGESVSLPQVRACLNFQLKVPTKKHQRPRVVEEDGQYRLSDDNTHPKLKEPISVKKGAVKADAVA